MDRTPIFSKDDFLEIMYFIRNDKIVSAMETFEEKTLPFLPNSEFARYHQLKTSIAIYKLSGLEDRKASSLTEMVAIIAKVFTDFNPDSTEPTTVSSEQHEAILAEFRNIRAEN